MAYPNYYQPNYQGYTPQPMPDYQQMRAQQQYRPVQMPAPMQGQQNTPPARIYVQGIAGAKAYLVAPGCEVVLWDSEAPVIYVKSADISGVPTMQVFDYTERNMYGGKGSEEFVTMAQFEKLVAFINERLVKKESAADE